VTFPSSSDNLSTTVERRTDPSNVVILGSTGSIGVNALEVIRYLPNRLSVLGLSAHSSWEQLFKQAQEFRPRWVVLSDPQAYEESNRSLLPKETQLLFGNDGIERMVSSKETNLVVSSIVGAAGLQGTWAALEAGKQVALANKESLVVAGEQITQLARDRGGKLLPVDSEHSAIFQALSYHSPNEVERIVLTASGGPFRGKTKEDLSSVRIEEALNHPTWRMGPKITIDSATLMNKSLEIIEAHWLFGLSPDQITVIIHPESIVHSFVEFRDGSVLAQLSPPDMKLPIQYALLYPERVPGPAKRMNWNELRELRFEQPDRETFEALDLGYEVIRQGGTCGAVLNAANEASVQRFLNQEIAFLDISRICRAVLANHHFVAKPSLAELLAADQWARQEVVRWTRL
jgi:1-deoxy-D-xylulose-5-phosphate reductoisomerase